MSKQNIFQKIAKSEEHISIERQFNDKGDKFWSRNLAENHCDLCACIKRHDERNYYGC